MVERAAWLVVGAVVLVFIVTTIILPFVVKGYSPPASVGTVMGSLAGGAAAYLFAKSADKKDGAHSPANGEADDPVE